MFKRFIRSIAFILLLGFSATLSAAPIPATSQNSKTHQLNKRLKNQMKEINEGVKSGRITQDQANKLKNILKSIRQTEVGFFKANGNKELTQDQQNQLNQSLNKNSEALGETPIK